MRSSAAGAQSLGGLVGEGGSPARESLGFTGTGYLGSISFTLLAALNIVFVLRAVAGNYNVRGGRPAEALSRGPLPGPIVRILEPVMHSITRTCQMYPAGLLFGLGLDTATERLLVVVVAGGAAVVALPWYVYMLILPTLFAAGMCLADTLDALVHGILAYGQG